MRLVRGLTLIYTRLPFREATIHRRVNRLTACSVVVVGGDFIVSLVTNLNFFSDLALIQVSLERCGFKYLRRLFYDRKFTFLESPSASADTQTNTLKVDYKTLSVFWLSRKLEALTQCCVWPGLFRKVWPVPWNLERRTLGRLDLMPQVCQAFLRVSVVSLSASLGYVAVTWKDDAWNGENELCWRL